MKVILEVTRIKIILNSINENVYVRLAQKFAVGKWERKKEKYHNEITFEWNEKLKSSSYSNLSQTNKIRFDVSKRRKIKRNPVCSTTLFSDSTHNRTE